MGTLTPETVRSGTEWFTIDDATASGAARRTAMRLAERLGFNQSRIGDVGIVVSEIATNVFRHAGHGSVGLQVALRNGRPGIEIVAIDTGPGMADIAASSLDGHSTAGTLGIGLGAITRLASSCEVSSQRDRGTVLVARLWAGDDDGAAFDLGGVTRPIANERTCGDAFAARSEGAGQLLLLADGLGHGELAAAASQEAIGVFHEMGSADPADIVNAIHQRTRHTRGSALAVAAIDGEFRQVAFAGVGNISAFVQFEDRRLPLLSQPGIVGHQIRTIRPMVLDLTDDALLVLHSDGLTERWSIDAIPGLRRCSATVIAATMLREAATRADDASVLVARRAVR